MLTLHNTRTRQKEAFTPLDPANVRMYVCGPTVYDRAHIGNGRAAVVFDVLYRVLCEAYGAEHVTYVRNITDVDDKINAAALDDPSPLSLVEKIRLLTERTTGYYHADMGAMGVLPPTVEPRATEHIAEIIALTETLMARGLAYEAAGHVYFRVSAFESYGALSGRTLDELLAGVRVEVSPHKQEPGDFVLWKPSDDTLPGWDSPWGRGRPGWHIECSAMSSRYLGADFDIHGGGVDLVFPHHENEIAQSCGAHPGSTYAHTWVHNGFLTVNGEKMSKSLGNFFTVHDLLQRGIPGEVIRYVLLSAHYRKPLDWNEKLVEDARSALNGLYRVLQETPPVTEGTVDAEFLAALRDDLNTPLAFARLHALVGSYHKAAASDKHTIAATLAASGQMLGFLHASPAQWFGGEPDAEIQALVDARIAAKAARNFAEADRLREELTARGIWLEDKRDGTVLWGRG
jgi:cysteinyl-tRNA synthetase